jgi:hypothetical protein
MLEALGRGGETQAQNKKRAAQQRSQQKLEKWINEKHTCENCGKVMTQYFGRGRFCSRSCANTRTHSEQTKQKIKESVLSSEQFKKSNCENIERRITANKLKYEQNPKLCNACGNVIPWEIKHRRTCSEQCLKKVLSLNGGYKRGSGNKKYMMGYYKGIWCNSSYELVFVIYCLDHNIPFKRSDRIYKYKYEGEWHNYYPDFIVNNKVLVEIKGRITDVDIYKFNSVDDITFVVLQKKNLKKMLNYVKSTYKYLKLSDLYDK